MTKRKGQTSDWKAPKSRAQRSRKRKAGEAEDDHLSKQDHDDPPVTETKKQDADNINSNSQNASASEATIQEQPVANMDTTDSSTMEVKELGDAVALNSESVSSGLEQGDAITSEAQENKSTPSVCVNAESVPTRDVQLCNSTTSDEHVSIQTGSSVQMISSVGAIDPSLDGQTIILSVGASNPLLDGQNLISSVGAIDPSLDGGCTPAVVEEKLGGELEMEMDSKDQLMEEGKGEEAAHLPKEKKPELGWEGSSQGTDGGGDPADPPARKKVRKRMGMGRLRGEKKNLLEEGRKNAMKDGGGGGEKDGGMVREDGLKMNDGPSLSEKQGTVQLVVAQIESNAALKYSSDETECSAQSQTEETSRILQNSSEMVPREDQYSPGPRKTFSIDEQKDVSPAKETDLMEEEGPEKSSEKDMKDNDIEAKLSHCPSATIKPTTQSAEDVGEATAGNQIQKPAVAAVTVAKHNIPDDPHKEEGAHHHHHHHYRPSDSGDVPESPEGTGTVGCGSVMSHSSPVKPNEPTAPPSGEDSNMREETTPVAVKGRDPEEPTDITPDLCHDPGRLDPSSISTVTDSQLNDITLIMELEDQQVPESSGCHEDATELVCGLIRELSALNRTIMAAHRELESVRRGNRTAKPPQRQPPTPRRPET